MTAMLPSHYHHDNPNAAGLASLYDHSGPVGPQLQSHSASGAGHPNPHLQGNLPGPKPPKFFFKVPRVVHDQKSKFESDDLFRRLARESEVRYTGFRDRPIDERKVHFQKGLRTGIIEIAITSNGTNINLHFSVPGSINYNNNNNNNVKDIDLDKEPGKAHIRSQFILNGVCVRWKGWMDLERLDGQGVIEYDEETAAEEERNFRDELDRHKARLREMDEKQRNYSRHPPTTTSGTPTPTAAAAAAAAAAALHHHHHHHHLQHHQYHGHSAHASEQNNIQVR